MSKNLNHFWVDGAVISQSLYEIPYARAFCLDDSCASIHRRYGMWVLVDNGKNFAWEHCSLSEFPKEFRLQLFLLGLN